MAYSALFILLISTACVLIQRYFPKPVIKPSQDPAIDIFRFVYVIGALIFGWYLPEQLQHSFGWDFGSNWLSRLAQIVGMVGMLFIAIRGLVVWLWIASISLLLLGLASVLGFIVGK